MERNKTCCRVTANRNTHKHTQLSHLERTLILCPKIPVTSDPCLGKQRHKKGKANALLVPSCECVCAPRSGTASENITGNETGGEREINLPAISAHE